MYVLDCSPAWSGNSTGNNGIWVFDTSNQGTPSSPSYNIYTIAFNSLGSNECLIPTNVTNCLVFDPVTNALFFPISDSGTSVDGGTRVVARYDLGTNVITSHVLQPPQPSTGINVILIVNGNLWVEMINGTASPSYSYFAILSTVDLSQISIYDIRGSIGYDFLLSFSVFGTDINNTYLAGLAYTYNYPNAGDNTSLWVVDPSTELLVYTGATSLVDSVQYQSTAISPDLTVITSDVYDIGSGTIHTYVWTGTAPSWTLQSGFLPPLNSYHSIGHTTLSSDPSRVYASDTSALYRAGAGDTSWNLVFNLPVPEVSILYFVPVLGEASHPNYPANYANGVFAATDQYVYRWSEAADNYLYWVYEFQPVPPNGWPAEIVYPDFIWFEAYTSNLPPPVDGHPAEIIYYTRFYDVSTYQLQPVMYYALRATSSTAPSGYIFWQNTTGDNTGRPNPPGTIGPTSILATWIGLG